MQYHTNRAAQLQLDQNLLKHAAISKKSQLQLTTIGHDWPKY